jgi:hypothetical protein
MLLAQQPVASAVAPHTIPNGTTFLLRLDDRLDTSRVRSGEHFKAKLAEDLVGPDGTRIPRGTKVKGHVSSADHGLHPRMLLSFDELETDRGWIPLLATVTGVPGEHSVATPDQEGEIERRDTTKQRDTDSTASGSDASSSGGVRGVGASIGSHVGAIVSLLSDHNVTLPKGTIIEARLDHPLRPPLP